VVGQSEADLSVRFDDVDPFSVDLVKFGFPAGALGSKANQGGEQDD
jgi:hypothetical protein